jgi:ubiquitin-activating enzyme E1
MSTAEIPLDNPASPPSKKPRLSAAGGGLIVKETPAANNNANTNHQSCSVDMNKAAAAANGSSNNNGSSSSSSGGNMEHNGIDEGLYSRQIYVLGKDAMARMALSNVLISGMGGLGVEIAKNVILGGVKSVTLQDNKSTTWDDLSSQYYLRKADIGKNRAEQSLNHLIELNPYVAVHTTMEILTPELINKGRYNAVVVTDGAGSYDNLCQVSQYCHQNGVGFILAETRGLFSRIFCDFGENFTVLDVNGEVPLSTLIAGVTKEEEGVVTCLDESRHGMEDGDYVTFSEVQGMIELNGHKPVPIEVTGPYTFRIRLDTTG